MKGSKQSPVRVGYVLKRFPRLSETFILNELLQLERMGVEVEIFSLLRPPQEPHHAMLKELRAPVTYLPSTSSAEAITVSKPINDGKLSKHPLTELVDQAQAPFDDAMPGKSGKETTTLVLKAASVAMLARMKGITHLHAHFGSDATTVAMLAARLSRLNYSFTAHARDIYHLYNTPETDACMRRAKIAEAAFVATVSDYNRQHLMALAGTEHASRIRRLYNGIDLNRFNPQAGVSRAPNKVLAVGRLVEKKGFGDLIEACRISREKGASFTCQIVGEGPLREQLARQISEAGLEGVVELCGAKPQEQLLQIMQTASMLVLPCIVTDSGDRDGLPTVLLEALACGLPCISTSVAGVPEIITHGQTGLLAEPGDCDAIAACMRRLLDSPDNREKFAAQGREKAEADFDLTKNVACLTDMFERSAQSQTIEPEGTPDEHRLRFG